MPPKISDYTEEELRKIFQHKTPSYKMYAGDWLLSPTIREFDLDEIGAYIQLLNHAWLDPDKGIIRDKKGIKKILNCSPKKFQKVFSKIEKCFIPHPYDPEKLANPKQLLTAISDWEYKKKMAERGRKGAKERWGKGDAQAMPKKCLSNAKDMQEGMLKNGLSSSSSTSSLKQEKSMSAPKGRTHSGAGDLLKFWVDSFADKNGEDPHYSPARDNAIMKRLAKTFGEDEVIARIPRHIASGKLPTVPGFETMWNQLGNQARASPARPKTRQEWGREETQKFLEGGG